MNSPLPIIVSGSIAIDRIMSFSGRYQDYIKADYLDKFSVSILLDELHDSHGGSGANITYSLAQLGDKPVLLGSVGPDANPYLKKLEQTGIDITNVHQSDLPTAAFNVISDAGENQLGGFYPGAMSDSQPLQFTPWRGQAVIAVVSPHDPKGMARQTAECKQLGLRLVYDVGQQVSNSPAEDLAAGVDAAEVLVLNDYEMTVLADKIERRPEQIKSAVPVVITTLGKDGSVIEGAKVPSPIKIGIVAPKQMVDPTGAGDAYRAGFLYGYSRSWDLKTCAQLGATCAAYAVESQGPQGHEFTYAQVAQRYQDNFNESLPNP